MTPSAPGAAPTTGAVGSAASTAVPSSVAAGGGGGGDVTAGGATNAQLPGTVGTGAAGGGGGGGGGEAGSWGSFLKSPSGLLTVGALGMDLAKGSPKPPEFGALTTEAQNLLSQGQKMGSYLETGTLPPGLQTSIDTATKDAQTSIRSKYAQMGESGSSAEAQDLQNVASRAVTEGASLAMQLMQQGTQDSQLGASIYENLMQTSMQEDQALSSSIGNFASAFAEMGRPVVAQGVGA